MDELTRLALAARDGDRLALASFVRRSKSEIWRFALRGVRAHPDRRLLVRGDGADLRCAGRHDPLAGGAAWGDHVATIDASEATGTA